MYKILSLAAVSLNPGVIHTEMLESCFGAIEAETGVEWTAAEFERVVDEVQVTLVRCPPDPVHGIQADHPQLLGQIHARGRDSHHCDQLLEAGATIAISETLEASLQIGREVLVEMGSLEDDAAELIRQFREDYYG